MFFLFKYILRWDYIDIYTQWMFSLSDYHLIFIISGNYSHPRRRFNHHFHYFMLMHNQHFFLFTNGQLRNMYLLTFYCAWLSFSSVIINENSCLNYHFLPLSHISKAPIWKLLSLLIHNQSFHAHANAFKPNSPNIFREKVYCLFTYSCFIK